MELTSSEETRIILVIHSWMQLSLCHKDWILIYSQPTNHVTSIKQSPVLKGHLFLVLSRWPLNTGLIV
jgi:hypothetical protein